MKAASRKGGARGAGSRIPVLGRRSQRMPEHAGMFVLGALLEILDRHDLGPCRAEVVPLGALWGFTRRVITSGVVEIHGMGVPLDEIYDQLALDPAH